jgi:cobalamin biosynthesis protein CobT
MSSTNEELTPRYKNSKPLRERTKGIHTSDKKEEEEQKDNKEEQEPNEERDNNEEEDNNEEPAEEPEDNEEYKILEEEKEKKAQEYAERSLKQMINGEELLTNMETFMESIRNLPENIYEENIENYAIVLSNTTIKGEKIFNDVEDAKQFINKVRNGGKTSKRYIKPRARIQFKQEIQKKLQLTPMISRNLKNRTNAINVYQY